jgi:hypothetical protein
MNVDYLPRVRTRHGIVTAAIVIKCIGPDLGTGCQEAGGKMFWLTGKRFSGSYFAFTDARRS